LTTYHFIRTFHRPDSFRDERGTGYEFECQPPEEGAMFWRPNYLSNGVAVIDWKVERPD